MRTRIAALLLACVLLSGAPRVSAQAAAGENAQSAPRPLVITRVTVVDVIAGRSTPDMTVLAEGGRIRAIGRSAQVRIPKDAQVVEASGKFIIPGLWDMHVHSFTDSGWDWLFPLLLANGVTGVREMGTRVPVERINEIRRETSAGTRLGPRYGAMTARILDGAGSQIPPGLAIESPDHARTVVKEQKAQGMDFVKVYNLLPRDAYLAVIDEAKRQKIAVSGHVPLSISASEASDLGQVSIEHFTDIFLSCSREEDVLREERRVARASGGAIRPAGPIESRAIASYDPGKAATVFERFRRNGTAVVPTIILSGTVAAERPREADARLKYIPAPTREYWNNAVNQSQRMLPAAADRDVRDKRKLDVVGLTHRTGVRLLAGTDAPNPYVFPGFSLHEELALMVQAGLSPLDALRTATLNPARFLGRDKDFGAVAPGRLADFVLLDADPLADIANTTKIHAVAIGGRLLDRHALDAMLEKVAAANGKKSFPPAGAQ